VDLAAETPTPGVDKRLASHIQPAAAAGGEFSDGVIRAV
jgi:hypothetical protein